MHGLGDGVSPPTSSSVWWLVPGSWSRAAMTAATSARETAPAGPAGGEPDPAGRRIVGEVSGAQDCPVQVPGAQVGFGGGLRRDVGSQTSVAALPGCLLPWRSLDEPAYPRLLGGVGHQHGGCPVDGVLAGDATARASAGREDHRVSTGEHDRDIIG